MTPRNKNVPTVGVPVSVHFLSGDEPCVICGKPATCALSRGAGTVIACSKCFHQHAPRLFNDLRAQLKTGVELLEGGAK
jgi:hypothetical protein